MNVCVILKTEQKGWPSPSGTLIKLKLISCLFVYTRSCNSSNDWSALCMNRSAKRDLKRDNTKFSMKEHQELTRAIN